MDKDKQPGINYDGIILVEEKFWRDYEVPDGSEIKFDINVSKNNIGREYNVEIESILKLIYEDKEVLSIESTFVGFFSVIEGKENMDIESFIKYNAVSFMIPYIREHISSITMKSGINPILLPPMNIYALYDD